MPHPEEVEKLVASAIFNDDICARDKRDKVRTCVEDVSSEVHAEMCSERKSPLHDTIRKYQMHTAFCDNRDTCFEKISEECRDDFWDQKWYMARCFQQKRDALSEEQWSDIENKFDQCLARKKVDIDQDDDQDESSSSEEGMDGSRKMRKLRRCISMRFANGPIRNPCTKINGQYKMMMDRHAPPHHGPRFGSGSGSHERRGPPHRRPPPPFHH